MEAFTDTLPMLCMGFKTNWRLFREFLKGNMALAKYTFFGPGELSVFCYYGKGCLQGCENPYKLCLLHYIQALIYCTTKLLIIICWPGGIVCFCYYGKGCLQGCESPYKLCVECLFRRYPRSLTHMAHEHYYPSYPRNPRNPRNPTL